MDTTWIRELRRLHEANYHCDWTSHLRDLNRRYDLGGRDELAIPDEGLPPSWFVGDVEALDPGRWVLVVSLNQANWAKKDQAWRRQERDSIRGDWDFWRLLNQKTWYGTFYSPMVRVGAVALGEEVPGEREQQQEFATTRMVFVESCPYSSPQFARGGEILARLVAEQDRGLKVLDRVRHLLIEEAHPALVLINGNPALDRLQALEGERLHLEEHRRYESISKPGKRLRHYEGRLDSRGGSVPVLAFPFVPGRKTHQSHREQEQLGAYGRALVGEALQ
ncbi:MAG: hypothetical protein F4X80_02915 [Chloroflexi bacterium]|nr:hypothetical protein [Chloroflexota bacterium]